MSSPSASLWIATATVVVCTSLLVRYPARALTLGEVLNGPAPQQAEATAFRAFAVFQPGDCRGNLEFLRIFQRETIRAHYALAGLLIGTAGQETDARTQLARRKIALPLRLLAGRELETISALGFRETPYILVIDAAGRVRLGAPAPSDHFERARLAAQLQQLAHLQEAP